MIKALMLVFMPVRTWDEIVQAQRGVLKILTIYLLPLLLVTSLIEGYGLVHWGEPQTIIKRQKLFTLNEAAAFEGVQLVLSLFVVFTGAGIVKSLGETFHGRHNFRQAITTVTYGLSPLFTLRIVDAFSINPWIAWAAGITLTTVILYHGVPRVMDPDPAHGFGLYLMSTLILAMATGLVRFLTAWYLQGRFGLPEATSLLHNSARHLVA